MLEFIMGILEFMHPFKQNGSSNYVKSFNLLFSFKLIWCNQCVFESASEYSPSTVSSLLTRIFHIKSHVLRILPTFLYCVYYIFIILRITKCIRRIYGVISVFLKPHLNIHLLLNSPYWRGFFILNHMFYVFCLFFVIVCITFL